MLYSLVDKIVSNRMKTIPFSEIRQHFTEVANHVQYDKERYILTKNNKPTFAFVPLEEIELLDKLLERFEDLDDVRVYKERKHEKASPINNLWKELDIK